MLYMTTKRTWLHENDQKHRADKTPEEEMSADVTWRTTSWDILPRALSEPLLIQIFLQQMRHTVMENMQTDHLCAFNSLPCVKSSHFFTVSGTVNMCFRFSTAAASCDKVRETYAKTDRRKTELEKDGSTWLCLEFSSRTDFNFSPSTLMEAYVASTSARELLMSRMSLKALYNWLRPVLTPSNWDWTAVFSCASTEAWNISVKTRMVK